MKKEHKDKKTDKKIKKVASKVSHSASSKKSNEMFPIDSAISNIMQKEFKFNESVELAVRLSSEETVKGECQLKYPSNQTKLIIFCSDFNKVSFIKEEENYLYGGEELVDSIKNKKSLIEGYKYSLATPDLMPKVGKIAKILGPRGLMPDPKLGFVTNELETMVNLIKNGKIFFKSDKTKILHIKIGKSSFTPQQLKENFYCLLESVKQLKPKSMNLNSFIRSVSLSSTMGKGFFIDLTELGAL